MLDPGQRRGTSEPGGLLEAADTLPYDDVSDLLGSAESRAALRAASASGSFVRLRWVRFKIIDGCNIKCVMCNHWRREGYRRQALSLRRLLELAEELAALGVRYVRWSGGEPTLRRDLPELISRFSELGIDSGITTNGTLLDADYAQRLCAARVRSVFVSLESADPAIHDRVVGAEGAFTKLLGGLAVLQQGSPPPRKVALQTVLTRLNTGPALAGLLDIAAAHGVKLVRFQPVVVSHLRDDEHELLPTAEQIVHFTGEILPALQAGGRRHGIAIELEGADLEEAPQALIPLSRLRGPRISPSGQHAQDYYIKHACYLPFYHCTIDHRGDVYPCCHMRDAEGLLGNIINQPLSSVLSSSTAIALRRRLSGSAPAACHTCTMQIAENQLIERLLAEEPGRGITSGQAG